MVPLDSCARLNQAAVVLAGSRQKEAARKFLDFVFSPGAASLLKSYELSLPAEAH
jgi:ABC-type molybdate transport system substrate-binding protein